MSIRIKSGRPLRARARPVSALPASRTWKDPRWRRARTNFKFNSLSSITRMVLLFIDPLSLFLMLAQGNQEAKRASFPQPFTFRPDLPAVQLHHPPRQGQTQPCSLKSPAGRSFRPARRVQKSAPDLPSESQSRVLHRDPNPVLSSAQAAIHSPGKASLCPSLPPKPIRPR